MEVHWAPPVSKCRTIFVVDGSPELSQSQSNEALGVRTAPLGECRRRNHPAIGHLPSCSTIPVAGPCAIEDALEANCPPIFVSFRNTEKMELLKYWKYLI